MTCEELTERIKKYRPFNEQEEADKVLILDWIGNNKNAFSRENTVAHMTASAWVVNKDRSKVLMVYHNIYNPGHGLADMRMEKQIFWLLPFERCVKKPVLPCVSCVGRNISLESLTVDGHIKRANMYPVICI